jgi:hypothetical protein
VKVVVVDRDDIHLGSYRGQPPDIGETLRLTFADGLYRSSATATYEVVERRFRVDAEGRGTAFVVASQIG